MYEVSSRSLREQPTLVMSAKVAVDEIPVFLGTAYAATADQVTKSGLVMTGPPFARMRPLDSEFGQFEIEAGFPVDRAVEIEGEVMSSTLPGGKAAFVTHIGAYDQMMPAYAALETWIVENQGVPDGPAWEVYYSDPTEQPDPSTWRTEIFQPYKSA
jgi:effector-binding domain-containing protein